MTRQKRAMYWVLKDGKNYYRDWLEGFGPRCTRTRGEAMRFSSKRKAMQDCAYSFSLTFFEPEAVRIPGAET